MTFVFKRELSTKGSRPGTECLDLSLLSLLVCEALLPKFVGYTITEASGTEVTKLSS